MLICVKLLTMCQVKVYLYMADMQHVLFVIQFLLNKNIYFLMKKKVLEKYRLLHISGYIDRNSCRDF